MTVSEICTPDAVWARPEMTILDAARLMREEHVGCVVVARTAGDAPFPVGLVTDRDLVLAVVAAGLDPALFTLGDIAARDLITVREDEDIHAAVRRMRAQGIRRLPVVDGEGVLRGILTLDDFVQVVGEEVREAAAIIDREQRHENQTRLPIGA